MFFNCFSVFLLLSFWHDFWGIQKPAKEEGTVREALGDGVSECVLKTAKKFEIKWIFSFFLGVSMRYPLRLIVEQYATSMTIKKCDAKWQQRLLRLHFYLSLCLPLFMSVSPVRLSGRLSTIMWKMKAYSYNPKCGVLKLLFWKIFSSFSWNYRQVVIFGLFAVVVVVVMVAMVWCRFGKVFSRAIVLGH